MFCTIQITCNILVCIIITFMKNINDQCLQKNYFVVPLYSRFISNKLFTKFIESLYLENKICKEIYKPSYPFLAAFASGNFHRISRCHSRPCWKPESISFFAFFTLWLHKLEFQPFRFMTRAKAFSEAELITEIWCLNICSKNFV